MNWKFWKKKNVEREIDLVDVSLLYIKKAKELNWSDEDIKKKFREKNYPEELIDLIFKLKGGKMVKKQKKKMEEDDEEEEEQEEQEQDEDEEEEQEDEEAEEEPEKPKKKKPEVKKIELTNEQIQAGIINLDNRLTQLEAAFFRLKQI